MFGCVGSVVNNKLGPRLLPSYHPYCHCEEQRDEATEVRESGSTSFNPGGLTLRNRHPPGVEDVAALGSRSRHSLLRDDKME